MLSEIRALAAETWREWNQDDAMQWGAALAFYAAISLAPLLVTVLAVVSLLFEEAAVQQRLVEFMGEQVGDAGAELTASILGGEQRGLFAGVSSVALVLVGATAVFGQVQKVLNRVWQVRAPGGIRRMLRTRLLGFAMLLCIGVLFLSALVVQAVLAALPEWGVLGRPASFAASTALFTLLFAAVYQVLPDVDIRWRDVWVGAAATALLFTLGQLLLGLYLGRSSVGSAYGAAGSLVALLFWLYYSAQVFLFGAEFTQVWARRRGRRMQPVRGAHRVETRRVAPPASTPVTPGVPGGQGAAGAQGPRGERLRRGPAAAEEPSPGASAADDGARRTHPPGPGRTRVGGKISYP